MRATGTEMTMPPIRWLRKFAIATAIVVPAGALLWAVLWLWSLLSLQWDSRTLIAIAIAALAFLAMIWWVWWRLPQRQVARLMLKIRDPKARADAEDNLRKTVGQALGGAAVLIGAGLAYWQFTQQQQTAYRQILAQQQASEANLKASRDLLISNQVSKGFEQLASDKITMRLGGIYALEGVMNTSDAYRQPVLDALCAFVRDGSTEVRNKPPTDIQAALTVISRRSEGRGQVELQEANLVNAVLIGANLGHTYLLNVNLHGADLTGANLFNALLNGADLRDAFLWYADLRTALLNNADLTAANLSHADLRGALLKQEQLNSACGTDAKLPPGLTLKKPCPQDYWKPVVVPVNPSATP